jgi:hypothetical protein
MSQWQRRQREGWVEVSTSPGLRSLLPLLLLGVGLVAAFTTLVCSDSEWLRVDACLDAGGSFDYESGECEHRANQRPVEP